MINITMQHDRRLSRLGHLDLALTERARVNGRGGDGGALAPETANTNDLPQARAHTGLMGGTRLEGHDRTIVVEDLRIGDLVETANGQQAEVCHILQAPVTRNAIYLRAPYFGLNQNLVLGADHRIAVTSHIAEYLFGEETVLVPAWALKDGRRAQHWEMAPRTHLYQIQLDRAAALKIGNCAVESMPKSGMSIGKVLTKDEARCFAAEHKSGYQT